MAAFAETVEPLLLREQLVDRSLKPDRTLYELLDNQLATGADVRMPPDAVAARRVTASPTPGLMASSAATLPEAPSSDAAVASSSRTPAASRTYARTTRLHAMMTFSCVLHRR